MPCPVFIAVWNVEIFSIFRAIKFYNSNNIRLLVISNCEMRYILFLFLYLEKGFCLWTKGIVHYTINSKDYDLHSQDIIRSTLAAVARETCLQFFQGNSSQILYISNPGRTENCPPHAYNFTGRVVEMPIGYKCISTKDIARIVVDMLRASVQHSPAPVNSFDLVRKFQEVESNPNSQSILSPQDRNFINSHYRGECGAQTERHSRRLAEDRLSEATENYYKDKLWPLGMVIYGVDKNLLNSPVHRAQLQQLQAAMVAIERASCVVFQPADDQLRARNVLWVAEHGGDPELGFVPGNQTVSLSSMSSRALAQLIRVLGLHMESNSYDRDYYVTVNWDNVQKGKEHYLEKAPREARVLDSLGYDFSSAAHAPHDFVCRRCARGGATVLPVQDQLWQRTLSMGRRSSLSESDAARMAALYQPLCRDRLHSH